MFCFHCLCICNTLVCSSLVEEIKNIIIITFVYQSLRRYTVLALDRSKYLPSSPIAYMFQYGVVIPFLLRILIRIRRTRTTLLGPIRKTSFSTSNNKSDQYSSKF